MSEKIFKETNLRSVVKVMSWRVSVTISHLINGFIVSGLWTIGAQIAGLAVIINMCLFWIHERIWNFILWNRNSSSTNTFEEGHPRTIGKSVTWRLLISINNFLIPYLTTGSWKQAAAFLGIATVINVILYYFHKRVWNLIDWGKKQNDSLVSK